MPGRETKCWRRDSPPPTGFKLPARRENASDSPHLEEKFITDGTGLRSRRWAGAGREGSESSMRRSPTVSVAADGVGAVGMGSVRLVPATRPHGHHRAPLPHRPSKEARPFLWSGRGWVDGERRWPSRRVDWAGRGGSPLGGGSLLVDTRSMPSSRSALVCGKRAASPLVDRCERSTCERGLLTAPTLRSVPVFSPPPSTPRARSLGPPSNPPPCHATALSVDSASLRRSRSSSSPQV